MCAAGRAILLPGKAIGAVLSRISKDLPEDQLTTVHEFHSQVTVSAKPTFFINHSFMHYVDYTTSVQCWQIYWSLPGTGRSGYAQVMRAAAFSRFDCCMYLYDE